MAKKLRKLADAHAIVFWILCVLVYVVGYKVVSVNILGKTPYSYDVAFFKLSLALLVILMMKAMYSGAFCFHMRTKNMWKGLVLLWPALLFLFYNVMGDVLRAERVVPETLLMVVISNMITGFYEEVIMRGMLLGHMMEHWKGTDRRVLKSVVATSVLFGAVHLGNLVYGAVFDTLLQVCYATIFGLVFAAAYLRTKNLWACILVHGIVDVSGSLYTIYYAPGEEITYYGSMGFLKFILMIVFMIVSLIGILFELRKKKRAEINELWNENIPCENLQ